MIFETNKRIAGTSEPADVDAFDAAFEVPTEAAPPLLTNRRQDYGMTRRSIFIGAAASLVCAPAIVRATSLMPVRSLPLLSNNSVEGFYRPPKNIGEFYRQCFYHSVDHGLRTGRMVASINGKIVPVADARRIVARARAQGWLAPEAA